MIPTTLKEAVRWSAVHPERPLYSEWGSRHHQPRHVCFERSAAKRDSSEAALLRSVSRDHACLHLRLVLQINLAELAAREGSLILATIGLANVKALFQEYQARSVDLAQRLVRQA